MNKQSLRYRILKAYYDNRNNDEFDIFQSFYNENKALVHGEVVWLRDEGYLKTFPVSKYISLDLSEEERKRANRELFDFLRISDKGVDEIERSKRKSLTVLITLTTAIAGGVIINAISPDNNIWKLIRCQSGDDTYQTIALDTLGNDSDKSTSECIKDSVAIIDPIIKDTVVNK